MAANIKWVEGYNWQIRKCPGGIRPVCVLVVLR
jgi:hypothetical protein